MREILFKAKGTDNGKWETGGSIIRFTDNGENSFYMPNFGEKCVVTYETKTDNIIMFDTCKFYKINPETLSQYIGATDEKGVKVFEHDIVKVNIFTQCTVVYDLIGAIEYNESMARFGVRINKTGEFLQWSKVIYKEVIGNIFDNPELARSVI